MKENLAGTQIFQQMKLHLPTAGTSTYAELTRSGAS